MTTKVDFSTMIGEDTITEMNKYNVKIESDNIDEMANIINLLKESVDSYEKNSKVGFFSRMFKSNIEIQASLMISTINFERCLKKGTTTLVKLLDQFATLEHAEESLSRLYQKFNDDILEIERIAAGNIDSMDRDRLHRRLNDLISAQLLAQTTAAQYKLSKNNVVTLIDKFKAIETILRPAVQHNQRLTDESLKKLKL